jgi:hypothetical protein
MPGSTGTGVGAWGSEVASGVRLVVVDIEGGAISRAATFVPPPLNVRCALSRGEEPAENR